MNVERLNILKKALLKHEDNGIRFDMDRWFVENCKDKNWCGTQACAMGLASTLAEFKKEGLREHFGTIEFHYFDFTKNVDFQVTVYDYHAAAKLFDISLDDAKYLFCPVFYKKHQKGNKGAKTVARRIAQYINSNGKSAQNRKS